MIQQDDLVAGLVAVVLAVQDSQDGQEQIQDIQVEADAGGNLLFDVIMAHDQLGVDEDISGEDEGRDDPIHQFDGRAVWEEGRHESEQNQRPQRPKQIRNPAREVVFGLACK